MLIAIDIVGALESAGANATMTTTIRHAMILAEHDGLSAAILDHALSDGDSSKLCARLKQRAIPFIIYSGYDRAIDANFDGALHVSKPATMDFLMTALENLLAGKPPRIS